MSMLSTLSLVAFTPAASSNPLITRRKKLLSKIDEQIELASNPNFTPTQHKWVTDLRHSISHAPRFGSYANPVRSKVEQSPYYWWWYALTLNEGYKALCADCAQRASTSSDSEKLQPDMLKVYEDFGDVRYEGDRYQAFCTWWRERVNTNEQRGAYLFAEPLRGTWTRVLTDETDLQSAWEDDGQIIIALPIHQTRHHAHKSLTRIVRKHIADQKGRAVSDPRTSKARYHLNTAV